MKNELSELIERARQGDEAAFAAAARLVEDMVRSVARGKLRSEKRRGLLQTTVLLDEVLLRLFQQGVPDSMSLRGFVSRVVHNLLIDEWRRQSAGRRGGGRRFVSLEDAGPITESDPGSKSDRDLEALDEALSRLSDSDPLAYQVAQHHKLLGMTLQETADALRVSLSTANRKWAVSKRQLLAFLREE